jgi:hypothetical protein
VGRLGFTFDLDLDRTGRWLKVVESQIHVRSAVNNSPLIRLEYDPDLQRAPIAHWRFHADSGLFTHWLTHAHLSGRDDVLLAVADPEVTYNAYDYGPGRFVNQRGHLAVVVAPSTRTVITVLLRSDDDWNDEDAQVVNRRGPVIRHPEATDRAVRDTAMVG